MPSLTFLTAAAAAAVGTIGVAAQTTPRAEIESLPGWTGKCCENVGGRFVVVHPLADAFAWSLPLVVASLNFVAVRHSFICFRALISSFAVASFVRPHFFAWLLRAASLVLRPSFVRSFDDHCPLCRSPFAVRSVALPIPFTADCCFAAFA